MSQLHEDGTDPARKIPAWMAWAAMGFVSYGIWAILSKLVGDAFSPAHSQAISTVGMLPMIAALAMLKGPADPGRPRRGRQVALVGGAVSCLGNLPFFMALGDQQAKAAAVFPVTALYPLVTILLAVAALRERLWNVQAAGIVLSLAATYLLNVPGESGLFSPWLLLALVPVVLWGVAGFLQKLSTFDVSGEASATWFLAAFVPVGAALFLWAGIPWDKPISLWALAAAMGFVLAFGNYAVTVAYSRNGKASVITPLVGLYPVLSIAAALLFFGERIGMREQLGIALALVSIAALSYEPAPEQSTEARPEINPS